MAYGYCDKCDEIFEDDEEDYEYCPYCGKDLDTHNSGCLGCLFLVIVLPSGLLGINQLLVGVL